MEIYGKYVDVVKRLIYRARVVVENGVVVLIEEVDDVPEVYIIPGMIDSHVHIESSMLIPQEFGRLAVAQGTVASVSDPHEIANVLGVEGVEYMLSDAQKTKFKIYFGVPSCVPATSFESSGGVLTAGDVEELLQRNEFKYLSEMMNFPGVICDDEDVYAKINSAHENGKVIDGHAPGLKGEGLKKYSDAGITTDHECVSVEEAVEKIKLGMKVLIREGSAAKNFDSLIGIIEQYPESVMLCTDDCHPDDLIEKHILDMIRRGVDKGYDVFDLLRAATLNPVNHYGLDVGLLQKGDKADFIVVDSLEDFNVLKTYIDGVEVYDGNKSKLSSVDVEVLNNFNRDLVSLRDIEVVDKGKDVKVIVAFDGDLFTKVEHVTPLCESGKLISDKENDVLKIVVVNRYNNSKPIVGFVKNFGLQKGAIAGSIAHDSHNIIAVGVDDADILKAVNSIIKSKGGICAVNNEFEFIIELPVAGLMSSRDGYFVGAEYKKINKIVKKWGSTLNSPFMTLSFMALLVIPEFKIGDKGLFDGNKFELTSLFVD